MCKIIYTIYLCGHRKSNIEDCPEGLTAKGAYPCGGPYFWKLRKQRKCRECVRHDNIIRAQEDAGLVAHQIRPLHSGCCDARKEVLSSGMSGSSSKSGVSFKERVASLRDAGEQFPF